MKLLIINLTALDTRPTYTKHTYCVYIINSNTTHLLITNETACNEEVRNETVKHLTSKRPANNE